MAPRFSVVFFLAVAVATMAIARPVQSKHIIDVTKLIGKTKAEAAKYLGDTLGKVGTWSDTRFFVSHYSKKPSYDLTITLNERSFVSYFSLRADRGTSMAKHLELVGLSAEKVTKVAVNRDGESKFQLNGVKGLPKGTTVVLDPKAGAAQSLDITLPVSESKSAG